MQYRTMFKKYYGINFSEDYDVHHIDLNHSNDDIENLMLIPKELHHKYHKYMNAVDGGNITKSFNAKICGNMVNSNSYTLEMIRQLIEVIEECNKWYDYKMYLDDKIGNIHNIKIGR